MKLVFVSNYFNHHQKPLCDKLDRSTDNEFFFISTSEMREERRNLGYGMDSMPDYVRQSHGLKGSEDECNELIMEADAVIYGSAPMSLIQPRLKAGKLTFKYSERIFKKPCKWYTLPARAIKYHMQWGRYKNFYLLSAGAYAAADYAKVGAFRKRAYKWGYFPEVKKYDIDRLLSEKSKDPTLKLFWAGRMIDWKHPEYALQIAERLHHDGFDLCLEMVGNGVMADELRCMAKDKGLSDHVVFTGSMKPEQVRERMEHADIFLFTSDRQEGWGAVLNEAMNSGCAVVASDAIGSVTYLIDHGENGFLFDDGNVEDAYRYVKRLASDTDLRYRLGASAYHTVSDVWNADIAAKRFLDLCGFLLKHPRCAVFESGPCSKIDEKDVVS